MPDVQRSACRGPNCSSLSTCKRFLLEHSLDDERTLHSDGRSDDRHLQSSQEKRETPLVKVFLYGFGRALQILGLLALPSALWINYVGYGEREVITVFVGSMVIFFVGWLITRSASQ